MTLFAFKQNGWGTTEFIVDLKKDEDIDHARRLLTGVDTERPHLMGRIRKQKANYNPSWDFYLDPDTIGFFDMAIEVCDADMQYVEDHLDEACGAFLPGCYWCPWSSKLSREVIPANA
jgi:hypothetical protein